MITFLSVFPPYRGGISTFSDFLYKELSRRTEVSALNYKKLYPDRLFPGKTQFMDKLVESYAERVLHSYNPLNWKKVAHKILRQNPDLYLYSHWHPFFAPANNRILSVLKKERPGLKTAGILHNILPHEYFPMQKHFITSLFAKTDYPVVLSEKSLNEYNHLHLSHKALKLFHPIYEQPLPEKSTTQIRSELGIEKEEVVILFFGLVRKYKGLDILIDALNKMDLQKYGIRPLIVGEFYIDRNKLLNRINPKHKDRYVFVSRFVTDDEIARYLSISDVMVLPYRSASQSGILSNALNFKLPVIVSNLEGLTEHVEDHKTGLVFEKENSDDLRDKISYYITADLKKEFAPNISIKIEKLSWKNFCKKLLNETRINNQTKH